MNIQGGQFSRKWFLNSNKLEFMEKGESFDFLKLKYCWAEVFSSLEVEQKGGGKSSFQASFLWGEKSFEQ